TVLVHPWFERGMGKKPLCAGKVSRVLAWSVKSSGSNLQQGINQALWHMPVIPALKNFEAGRSIVQGQSGIYSKLLFKKN
ncbi:hypothetical protein ACQP3L_33945, partial [Escherichia coli]